MDQNTPSFEQALPLQINVHVSMRVVVLLPSDNQTKSTEHSADLTNKLRNTSPASTSPIGEQFKKSAAGIQTMYQPESRTALGTRSDDGLLSRFDNGRRTIGSNANGSRQPLPDIQLELQDTKEAAGGTQEVLDNNEMGAFLFDVQQPQAHVELTLDEITPVDTNYTPTGGGSPSSLPVRFKFEPVEYGGCEQFEPVKPRFVRLRKCCACCRRRRAPVRCRIEGKNRRTPGEIDAVG